MSPKNAARHPAYRLFEKLAPRALLGDVGGHIATDTIWGCTRESYRLVPRHYNSEDAATL